MAFRNLNLAFLSCSLNPSRCADSQPKPIAYLKTCSSCHIHVPSFETCIWVQEVGVSGVHTPETPVGRNVRRIYAGVSGRSGYQNFFKGAEVGVTPQTPPTPSTPKPRLLLPRSPPGHLAAPDSGRATGSPPSPAAAGSFPTRGLLSWTPVKSPLPLPLGLDLDV